MGDFYLPFVTLLGHGYFMLQSNTAIPRVIMETEAMIVLDKRTSNAL